MKSAAIRICLIGFMMFAMPLLQAQLFARDNAQTEEALKPSAPAGSLYGMRYLKSQLQFDLDGDGFVTQDEWNRIFVKIDENGDKRLSVQEMQKTSDDADEEADSNDGLMAAFTRLDRNGNGSIELSEWPGKKRGFRYLDSNRDGLLSREEFMSRKAQLWNQVFENLDFDGNKLISRAEWMYSEGAFDRLDRNHDGYISRREFYNPR